MIQFCIATLAASAFRMLLAGMPSWSNNSRRRGFWRFFLRFLLFAPIFIGDSGSARRAHPQIIREKREIRGMEMVPFSRIGIFAKARSADGARSAVRCPRTTMSRLIQIGSFVDLVRGQCGCAHTGEAGFFRFLTRKILEMNCYRIFGVAARTRKNCRRQIQQWKDFPELDHESGERAGVLGLCWRAIGYGSLQAWASGEAD